MLTSNLTGKLMVIAAFAVAMAFLEAAVVIYLRELYYPGGFGFPLSEMDPTLALTEFLREAATMVMLISIGFLLGRRPVEVFAIFLISFGIWDIFYYVFLKCLISWPSSFLTWDILFLIPVLWVGPVIAPILNSLVMVALGYLILLFSGRNVNPNLSKTEWIFLIGGAALVYISYTEEFTRYLRDHLPVEGIRQLSTRFIPQYYRWWLFLSGFFLHIAAIIHYTVRIRRLTRSILSPP